MSHERRPPTFYDSARDTEFGMALTNLVSLAYGAQLHKDRREGIVTNTTMAEVEIKLGGGQRIACDFYGEQDVGSVVIQSTHFTQLDKQLDVYAVWNIMDDIKASMLDDVIKRQYFGTPDKIRNAAIETFTTKVVCVDVGSRAPAGVKTEMGYCIDGYEVLRSELTNEETTELTTTFDEHDFASVAQTLYLLGLVESEQIQAVIDKMY